MDRFILKPGVEKQLTKGIQNALLVGDQFLKIHVASCGSKRDADRFYASFGCPEHHLAVGDLVPDYFQFNNPSSACRTCLGLGTYMVVHRDLLVPGQVVEYTRWLFCEGCFQLQSPIPGPDASCTVSPDTWILAWIRPSVNYLLTCRTYFSTARPTNSPCCRRPMTREQYHKHLGKPWGFGGIGKGIERNYKRYRQKQVASSGMEAWLERVMMERVCPDCRGSRLKESRHLFRINGRTVHDYGEINFDELAMNWIRSNLLDARCSPANRLYERSPAASIFCWASASITWVSSPRRHPVWRRGPANPLSTQIGSGLMGMLYVLDEPSIGLHPKDNVKMIRTLRQLRDLGNTVIVVEHDEETIRAADHIVEMGPGPGGTAGSCRAGSMSDILNCPASPTGQYLSGARPSKHREIDVVSRTGRCASWVRGEQSQEHRRGYSPGAVCLRDRCVGFRKSTLINEILFKKLYNLLYDSPRAFRRPLTGLKAKSTSGT